MNFLIIGLGSMGKRRIRCLQHLGIKLITGLDLRADRREEASAMYGIQTICSIENDDIGKYDAIIVSTPPDKHTEYVKMAIENKKPVFIERDTFFQYKPEIGRSILHAQVSSCD